MTRIGVSLAAALLIAAPAAAQTLDEHWKRCESRDPDLSIGGCTAVIRHGGETSENLAIAFVNRGLSYRRLGQTERAIQDYDEAIRLNPASVNAFNNRCWARAILGQLDPALQDCTEALRLRPNTAAILDSRGLVHLKAGRLDASIADYAAALRLEPGRPFSLYGRGIARQRKGDAAGGAADIAAAKAAKADIAEEMAKLGVK